MQVLIVFMFWMSGVLNGTPNQQGISSANTDKAKAEAFMPVKLLAFNGKTDGTRNILEWRTTSEVNTREFIIETSVDGDDFKLAAWVTPKGAPNSPTYYRYTDTTAGAQTHYRLRMVDGDGKEQISRVVTITRQSVSKS